MSKKRKTIWIQMILIIIVIALYFLIHSKFVGEMSKCWFNEQMGILCPTCGGTRCVRAFLEGDFKNSFYYHTIFFITILYLIIVDFLYVLNTITNKKIATRIYPKVHFIIIWGVMLTIYTIYRNIF